MKWKMGAIALLASLSAQADECGSVTISDMNWNSASLIANVDKFILDAGFGCDVELIPGDTMPTTTSMVEKEQPDIAPELWTNAVKEIIDNAIQEGRLTKAGESLVDGGEEGFWVPKYMVEQYPELTTIEGVKKHPELFEHPEDPDVGGFYSCPAGWNCQIGVANLFKALDMEKAGFEIVDPGSSAGLAGSIAKSYERKEGWVGYYWAPTAILGKYEMVRVDLGSGVDKQEYLSCTTQEDCDNPKVTEFPKSVVSTIATTKFAASHPQVMEYLSKRSLKNADLNKLLAWMENEQATAEEAMYYFLENYSNIWKTWVPADAAKKVEAEL